MFPRRRCAARSVLLCDRSLINFLFLLNTYTHVVYMPPYKNTNINSAGISSTHPICLPTTTEIHNKILALLIMILIFFFLFLGLLSYPSLIPFFVCTRGRGVHLSSRAVRYFIWFFIIFYWPIMRGCCARDSICTRCWCRHSYPSSGWSVGWWDSVGRHLRWYWFCTERYGAFMVNPSTQFSEYNIDAERTSKWHQVTWQTQIF